MAKLAQAFFLALLCTTASAAEQPNWFDKPGAIVCNSSDDGLDGGILVKLDANRTKMTVRMNYGAKEKEYKASKTEEGKNFAIYESSSWIDSPFDLHLDLAQGNFLAVGGHEFGVECSLAKP